jgi:L-threonylcarbamoyladenylate synthase
MRTIKIADLTPQEIAIIASKELEKGGVVIYPTETCYGIGVDSTNTLAIQKLLKYKGDRKGKPISVAVCDKQMANDYIEFNPQAENLFNNFLPGPITIVANGKHKVSSNLESEDGKLGIRYPKQALALKIISAFGRPITSTSANISHGKTPYEIKKDILDRIPDSKKDLIDLIIDAGKLDYHPPSTIVDTTLNDPKIIRQGEFVMPETAHEYLLENVEDTVRIAEEFTNLRINELKNNKCLIFALQGDLGAGKTQFAKGVARALGIKAKIKSPTFILCSEYSFSFPLRTTDYVLRTLFHIDTWRMEKEEELNEIGFEKMLCPGNVIVIEWGEKAMGVLKEIEKRKDVKMVKIKIEAVGENTRKILTNTN